MGGSQKFNQFQIFPKVGPRGAIKCPTFPNFQKIAIKVGVQLLDWVGGSQRRIKQNSTLVVDEVEIGNLLPMAKYTY